MLGDEQVRDAAVLTFPNSSEGRLRIALRNLDAALEEQRQAVAAFRGELAKLGSAMQDLGESTYGLQDRLHEAAEDTAMARDAALRLQRMSRCFRPSSRRCSRSPAATMPNRRRP